MTKRYGELYAVKSVSLEVGAGEFVTLLGPSGSGKTTLLRMVAGFTRPDRGTVTVDDRDIGRMPPYKRDIGMVFQHYALFPHMTAGDNIGFPLKMRGVARAEVDRRVAEALELVRLQGFGHRMPHQLSGGQQQRIALARAVVFEPTVLLMDEPLGALDKRLREALAVEIARISRRLGLTVIYVTHDQEEALVMSDRIGIFNQGQIEQVGRSDELYERPASLFVAQFMGESNAFAGRFETSGDEGIVSCEDCSIRVSLESVRRAHLTAGQQAAVIVRPERLQLAKSPEQGPAALSSAIAGSMDGVVREVTYLGPLRKYLIDTPAGRSLQARVQVGQAHDSLVPGDRVSVSWDVEHSVCVAVPSEPDKPGAGT